MNLKKKFGLTILITITLLSIFDLYASTEQFWQPAFIKQFEVGPIPLTQIYLNVVGFLVPLIVSIVCVTLYFLLDLNPKITKWWHAWTVIYFCLFIIILLVSYFYFPFEYITSHRGGGVNILLFLMTLIMLIFVTGNIEDLRLLVIISYPFFFLVGLGSDVIAVNYFEPGRLVFGGSGIYDVDFTFPLLLGFVLFSWIRVIYNFHPKL